LLREAAAGAHAGREIAYGLNRPRIAVVAAQLPARDVGPPLVVTADGIDGGVGYGADIAGKKPLIHGDAVYSFPG